MSEYKIEKNIEMPEQGKKGAKRKYPFGDMDVGDSFLFSGGIDSAMTVRSAVSYYGARNSKKFSVIKINNDEYRVFRIE